MDAVRARAELAAIRERLLAVDAKTANDGQRYIERHGAQAAKILFGYFNGGGDLSADLFADPDHGFVIEGPWPDLERDDTDKWHEHWRHLCYCLQPAFPLRIPADAGVLEWREKDGVRTANPQVKDWRERARDYADVCRIVADAMQHGCGTQAEAGFPKWDRDRRQLLVGDAVVREYKRSAKYQMLVLDAFQEQDWQRTIDDPIPPDKHVDAVERLRNTVESLNEGQTAIRFAMNGSGNGISWSFRTNPT